MGEETGRGTEREQKGRRVREGEKEKGGGEKGRERETFSKY